MPMSTVPPSPPARNRGAHLLGGVGPEAAERERPDALAAIAQVVDDVLDRAEHRAQRDHDRVGVLQAVPAHEPARVAAERGGEVAGDARDRVEREPLLGVHEVAHLHERLRPDHRADRDRLVGIEHLARRERGQEGVHGGLLGQLDALVGVGEDEAVHAHHDRQRDLLGEPNACTCRSIASWLDSA
jgi:hypothetical protein